MLSNLLRSLQLPDKWKSAGLNLPVQSYVLNRQTISLYIVWWWFGWGDLLILSKEVMQALVSLYLSDYSHFCNEISDTVIPKCNLFINSNNTLLWTYSMHTVLTAGLQHAKLIATFWQMATVMATSLVVNVRQQLWRFEPGK